MENKLINDILKKFNINYEEDLRRKLDSMRIVSLIMEIEEKFNVEIKETDFIIIDKNYYSVFNY